MGSDIIEIVIPDLNIDDNITKVRDMYPLIREDLALETENAFKGRTVRNKILQRQLLTYVAMKEMNCTYEQLNRTSYEVIIRSMMFGRIQNAVSQ